MHCLYTADTGILKMNRAAKDAPGGLQTVTYASPRLKVTARLLLEDSDRRAAPRAGAGRAHRARPPVAESTPQRVQVPRQTRLFTENESGKVLQFPSAPKPSETQAQVTPAFSASSRQPGVFPRFFFLRRSMCREPSRRKWKRRFTATRRWLTPAHRAVAFALDFSIVMMAFGVFSF